MLFIIALAALSSFGAVVSQTSPAAVQADQTQTLSDAARTAQPATGVRAGFWWADFDRDGYDDAFVIGADGASRLLRNWGDGTFADVTALSGLDGLGEASFAAWQDFDRDGAPDVFVGTQSGPGHLMRNAGDGTFQDVTQFVGLTHEGRHLAAQWFDYDLDGLVDLAVRTDSGERLYHALSDGHFEAVDLGSAKPRPIIASSTDSIEVDAELGVEVNTSDASDADGERLRARRPVSRPPPVSTSVSAPSMRLVSTPPSLPPGIYSISACPPGIADSAGGGCLQASSVATLGMLHPLSINLNVSGAGNVGIGTITPAAKLDVAGTARISNTLTLNPAGDQALNLASGSIYLGGLRFAHARGGSNTAVGLEALAGSTPGLSNTASGVRALFSNNGGDFNVAMGVHALTTNTSGRSNTAIGTDAMYWNTIGFVNSAVGVQALFSNTSGYFNTAMGAGALRLNTTGHTNTASGFYALGANTTASDNTAIGNSALRNNTTGERNTASGSQALFTNTNGAFNTATGSRSLYANTTGQLNTATGSSALRANTTGGSNTASGSYALSANTSASYNTAVGSYSLASNTSGDSNTASGASALLNNTSGNRNTAMGFAALRANTIGKYNTASGSRALQSNSSGKYNTAGGYGALLANTTGSYNTADGGSALRSNTSGGLNTATGYRALFSNASGAYNTACGNNALFNSTGSRNTALGRGAGFNLTTGNDNVMIGNSGVAAEGATIRIGTSGTQTRAFVAGIRGVTTVNANAIPVLVDSAGQLGTVSSSRRFKQDIVDMGDATSRLLELRPVRFRYKQEQTLPDGSEVPMEYGLIAEEVAEVFPDLVVYGDDGKPFTVKYHILSSMLLNEMKRLKAANEREREEQQREIKLLREELSSMNERHAAALKSLEERLEARFAALEAR